MDTFPAADRRAGRFNGPRTSGGAITCRSVFAKPTTTILTERQAHCLGYLGTGTGLIVNLRPECDKKIEYQTPTKKLRTDGLIEEKGASK